MQGIGARATRAALVVLVLSSVLWVAGCGGGGEAGGAYLSVEFVNDPTSPHAITKVDFDYFDISALANRVESVVITPGNNDSFEFDSFLASNLFDVTLTWSDASTTVIVLVPFASGGGKLSYPVLH